MGIRVKHLIGILVVGIAFPNIHYSQSSALSLKEVPRSISKDE